MIEKEIQEPIVRKLFGQCSGGAEIPKGSVHMIGTLW